MAQRLFATSSATSAARVALVTGGGSGIGRAVCNLLSRESNISIVAADVNLKNASETTTGLQSNDPSVRHLPLEVDVSKKDSVANLFQSTIDFYKIPPSIIVNCAGITRDAKLFDMTEEKFDEVMSVNLKGTFLPIQIGCKHMVDANVTEGSIVNVSSISGKCGNFGQTNYASSKSAIYGLTKTVAKEMAKHNIRCNAVVPGFIDTPMVASVPEKIQMMMNLLIPMGRQGKPEEVAEAIVFLALPKSSYITGAMLDVTGGLFM